MLDPGVKSSNWRCEWIKHESSFTSSNLILLHFVAAVITARARFKVQGSTAIDQKKI